MLRKMQPIVIITMILSLVSSGHAQRTPGPWRIVSKITYNGHDPKAYKSKPFTVRAEWNIILTSGTGKPEGHGMIDYHKFTEAYGVAIVPTSGGVTDTHGVYRPNHTKTPWKAFHKTGSGTNRLVDVETGAGKYYLIFITNQPFVATVVTRDWQGTH